MSARGVLLAILLLGQPAWGQEGPRAQEGGGKPRPYDGHRDPEVEPGVYADPHDGQRDSEVEPGVYADPDEGLGYRDSEVPIELRWRAVLAADYRAYDRRNVRDAGPRLDRALLGVEGDAFDLLSFRVLADLRGTDTRGGLEEAWLTFDPTGSRLIRLTAGLLKIPLGIEAAFPEETLPYLDHAFPDRLTSRHDLAARLDGELLEGLLSWDVTLGFGEGFDGNGQRLDDPQLSARLTSYPFRWLDDAIELGDTRITLLSGLFLSGAVAHSWGPSSQYEIPTAFRNNLVVSPGLDAERRQFLHLGYGLDLGPLRVVHEFARGSLFGLETALGDQDLEGDFSAWALSVSLRLGGEPYDSRPLRQFEARRQGPSDSLPAGGPGVFELGFRYSNSEWDRDLFQPLGLIPIVTGGNTPLGPGGSSQEFRTVEGSLIWSPVRTVRLGVYVIRVIADQFPGVFDSHGRDTSFAVRLQVDL